MRRLEGTSILAAITISAALLTAEPASAAVAPGDRDMTFGVHGTASQFPGLSPGDAEQSVLAYAMTFTPGKIWIAGRQAHRGYATRLTSSGRTDLSFGATELFAGGDTVFASVAFALPRPNGGAFVISQNQSRVGANLAWFVQALHAAESNPRGGIAASHGAVPCVAAKA